MNITIISVGKLKENYLKQAVSEYSKRITKYSKLNLIELPDEKTPDNASDKEEELIKNKEGIKILNHIKDSMYVIALDLKGKMIDSVEFSELIDERKLRGDSSLCFVIGGSLGISSEVLKRADYSLCFSKMTFPHQLFRVMLLEQIYRAFRISFGEPYHK